MARERKRLPGFLARLEPAELSQLLAVVLCAVVVVLVNVVAARRYTRWDLTTNKRYSLSPATVQTLRDLPEVVQIWVLLGPSDPLEQSVKQLLVAYQAETTKLEVHYVDPDRDTAALEDVRQRFKIETGRTEQGHVVTDAVVVVARGDRRWFLTAADMIEISGGEGAEVKPKEEQALTGAVRNVLGGSKARICFTTGHGEMSPLEAGERGVGVLRDVLEKDNYEVTVVDPGGPGAKEPFAGCTLAVVAGMRGGFAAEEADRLRAWLLAGGNLFVAASPITGETPTGMAPSGLDRVLAPFGLALDDALVVETDEERAFPGTGGIRFVAEPKAHPVTTSLVRSDERRDVPRVVLHFARPLHKVAAEGGASAQELLVTSPGAFGLLSVAGAADWKDAPVKGASDLGGPLVVAMASERPKTESGAPHGPRVVVLGTASALTASTFREPLPVRGAALFVESAISWLAAKPQVLDVPARSAVAAGLRITDDARAEIRRYVLFFMPGAVALAGVVVALVRRAGEGKKGRSSKKRDAAS